jgi:deoxyhypusine monooxygenase
MAPTATSPTLPATRRAPTSTTISTLRTALCSESTPLAQRYRALFALKHVASTHPPTPFTLPALHAIAAAFQSPSALLKHEVAYCLGQTGSLEARPYLRSRLEDEAEDPMCRHEAAEALGALGDAESLDLLRRFRDRKDVPGVVRETCEIAVERIEWVGSDEGKGGTRKRFASCILTGR